MTKWIASLYGLGISANNNKKKGPVALVSLCLKMNGVAGFLFLPPGTTTKLKVRGPEDTPNDPKNLIRHIR